jgi:hypothetical protein
MEESMVHGPREHATGDHTHEFKRSKNVKLDGIIECKLLSKNEHRARQHSVAEEAFVETTW